MPVVMVLDTGVSQDVRTHGAVGCAYLTLYSAGLCSTWGSINDPVFPLFWPPPDSFKSFFLHRGAG